MQWYCIVAAFANLVKLLSNANLLMIPHLTLLKNAIQNLDQIYHQNTSKIALTADHIAEIKDYTHFLNYGCNNKSIKTRMFIFSLLGN